MAFDLLYVIYVEVMPIRKVSIRYGWAAILFFCKTFQSHFNWEQICILLESSEHHYAFDFNAYYEKKQRLNFGIIRAVNHCCQPKCFAVEITHINIIKMIFPYKKKLLYHFWSCVSCNKSRIYTRYRKEENKEFCWN